MSHLALLMSQRSLLRSQLSTSIKVSQTGLSLELVVLSQDRPITNLLKITTTVHLMATPNGPKTQAFRTLSVVSKTMEIHVLISDLAARSVTLLLELMNSRQKMTKSIRLKTSTISPRTVSASSELRANHTLAGIPSIVLNSLMKIEKSSSKAQVIVIMIAIGNSMKSKSEKVSALLVLMVTFLKRCTMKT